MVFLFVRDHGNQSKEAKTTYACLGKRIEEKNTWPILLQLLYW